MHAVLYDQAASHPLVPFLENPPVATDLISFLKDLPDCRMRCGIRFPSCGCFCWWRSSPSTASRKADAYNTQGSLMVPVQGAGGN